MIISLCCTFLFTGICEKTREKDRNQVTRNWLYLINKKYHIHYEEINTKIKINKDK